MISNQIGKVKLERVKISEWHLRETLDSFYY